MATITSDEAFKKLVSKIGKNQAMMVMDMFAGETIYFAHKARINEKHLKIICEFKKGASYTLLAQKYDYTNTRIRQIVKDCKEQEGKFSWKNIFAFFKAT